MTRRWRTFLLCLIVLASTGTAQLDKDVRYLKARAQRLMEERNLGFAIKHLDRAIGLFPKDGELRLLLGECHYQREEWKAAGEAFASGVKLRPDLLSRVPHYPLSVLRAGDVAEARRIYESMVATGTDKGIENGEYGLGMLLIHDGKLEAALGHLKRALTYDPKSEKINFRLGYVLQRQGRLKEARRHFEVVAARNRLHEPALHALALVCFRLGDKKAAGKWKAAHEKARAAMVRIGDCQRALAKNAGDLAALRTLADLYFEFHRWSKAQGPYRALTASQPKNPEPRFRYAYCAFQLGRILEARQQLEQMRRRYPGYEPAAELLRQMNAKRDAKSKELEKKSSGPTPRSGAGS